MSHIFVDHMFITESSHHPISRKELGQLCMYHLHVSPCNQCFVVFLIEFPLETESSSPTKRLYTRYYSELWCGGDVAQMQSIQQTGFLGIRQGGEKKKPQLHCCLSALSLRCLILLSHTRKSLWQGALPLKAQTAKDVFFTLQHF